jgi:hypothetical protein
LPNFCTGRKKFRTFFATAEKFALVFFAQEREVTLTWSIAEKYIGHFFCKGTQCSGTFFQQKNTFNPSKSKLWVENFRPFFTSICRIFLHSFYSKFFSNLGNLHKICPRAGKDEVSR